MKLFIPACGDRLTLISPWTFRLFLEHRNIKFAEVQNLLTEEEKKKISYNGITVSGSYDKYKIVPVTLQTETIIECDRVYIRQNSKAKLHEENDYDSVTWKVIKDNKPAKKQRFWVKLCDCNTIEYELRGKTKTAALYQERVKVIKLAFEALK